MEWFFIAEDRQIGPIPDEPFRELVKNGSILRTTSVWRSGMDKWAVASTIEGLMPPPAAPQPTNQLSQFLNGASSKPYRDLVQHHLQRYSPGHLQKAVLGETAGLPSDIRDGVVEYIDAVGAALSYDASFWESASCQTALVRILGIAGATFPSAKIPASVAEAVRPENHSLSFSLFQVATLSFAYSASTQRKQREFMGIKKGLFG